MKFAAFWFQCHSNLFPCVHLTSNRRQVIIWTDKGLVYRRKSSFLGLSELRKKMADGGMSLCALFTLCCGLMTVKFTNILQGYFAGNGAILWLPVEQPCKLWVNISHECTKNNYDIRNETRHSKNHVYISRDILAAGHNINSLTLTLCHCCAHIDKILIHFQANFRDWWPKHLFRNCPPDVTELYWW